MDATSPVRDYLRINNVHDYDVQQQGPANKIILDCLIYQYDNVFQSRASLYRPQTKTGDPRIWFAGLNNNANPNDILVLICFSNKLHVINLTQLPVEQLVTSCAVNPLKEFILEYNRQENAVAGELLDKLTAIAQSGPLPSLVNADTSVGRTLETALGIEINSSPLPDYKGIELKSFRTQGSNRKNLFAQVPNWELSLFKSSAEILDTFGYFREDIFKLYCTVSTLVNNSQGLSLRIEADRWLVEHSNRQDIGGFVVWELERLHKKLLEKHRETFWVAAESIQINNREYFQYTKVMHTRKPIVSQFDILLDQGIITLDHLIKRNARGQVSEKGPLFKITKNGLELLFPPSVKYSLI